MFEKVLIANRGEIACRIMRTCGRLGIRTVAVFSEADADALHVETADEAWPIGPAEPRESYLDIDAVIAAARRSGADAVHPGYGFLAENAAFAEACEAAGIVFIGPPPSAIRAMGGKSEAKALMAQAGVPLVPGYHGAEQEPALLAREAERIGYPLLIKASAGGGGKGMKVVEAPAEFGTALASARREALAAFGDERMLLERYLARPRHVEIQVFADTHGNCIHLFERDCSIQRRHQKVVEEAPAPGLTEALRARMGEAATAAATAIGYRSAGTVEFLLDEDGSFYFMEMNTRLQVEHPVTEFITRLDLVEWQLKVAAGEPLPLVQDDLAIHGHAIEVRLYAEDPEHGFLPQTGRLTHLRFPPADRHVRTDTGVRTGDGIGIHYDPMIAKLIVWDESRAAAVRRLQAALAGTEVAGLTTNLPFLQAIAGHPAFAAAELDTRFIERHADRLLAAAAEPTPELLGMAALGLLLDREAAASRAAITGPDPHSPWHRTDGWRLNAEASEPLSFRAGDQVLEVNVGYHRRDGGYRLVLPDGSTVKAAGRLAVDGQLTATLDGVRRRATWLRQGRAISVLAASGSLRVDLVDPVAAAVAEDGPAGFVTAPMPGKITALLAEPGAEVAAGTPLLVLEAMKMEHTIKAQRPGRLVRFRYAPGEQVEDGALLVEMEAHSPD